MIGIEAGGRGAGLGEHAARLAAHQGFSGARPGVLQGTYSYLLQDNDGDYFFLYYQGKMRKEHHVPITRELAKVVKEQQSYMRERFTGQSLPYLFMTRRSQPYKRGSLAVIINSVAHKHDIRGAEVNRSGSNRMASATV